MVHSSTSWKCQCFSPTQWYILLALERSTMRKQMTTNRHRNIMKGQAPITHTPVMCKRMCYRDWSWGIISAWSAAREKRAIWFLASDATCEADLSDPWSYLWTKHIAVQSLAKRRWITRDSRMIREIGTCNAIWSNTYLQESKARSLKSSGLLQ